MQDFSGSIYGGSGSDTHIEAGRTIANTIIRGDGGRTISICTASPIQSSIAPDDDDISIAGSIINSQIYTGRQKDQLVISGNTVNLIRGDANEDIITITGSLQNTIVNGNANNDQIVQLKHCKFINYGEYEDNIDINGAIYVSGGADADDIDLTSNENHTVYGGSGNDTVDTDSTEPIFIDGGTDNDIISITGVATGQAFHTVDGAEGDDSISGGGGGTIGWRHR